MSRELELVVTLTFDSLWGGLPPSLLASRSRISGAWEFPPVPEDSPRLAEFDPAAVCGQGALYSFTIIHPSPKLGLKPYALGYVDFDGPVRIFGRLVGSDQPVIGSNYIPIKDEAFGYVFQLAES